ncbi:phosphopantetheine-binding protein, partial [Aquimarina sp. RZ0]|uniref:phosphopantetheine-binding protein n=1 Tax=Aquimarina sp. RZ0 TaxID=2607730 RepID=UPI0011F1CCAF
LGGHSLLATRLVSMIRKELSIEVSIRDVFEHTTIEALGRHIEFMKLDLDQNNTTEDYNITIEL